MAKAKDGQNDEQPIGADDRAEVVTLSRGDYDALIAAGTGNANPEPAWEEGPHLDDPAVRAAKRQQLRAAGMDHEADGLSDDARALLRERGEDE